MLQCCKPIRIKKIYRICFQVLSTVYNPRALLLCLMNYLDLRKIVVFPDVDFCTITYVRLNGNCKLLIAHSHLEDNPKWKVHFLSFYKIKELVSEDEFSRYERILYQTALDTMNDVMFCPLKHCQAPVVIEPEEIIGICSVCKYSFCIHCKLANHGVEPCRLKAG